MKRKPMATRHDESTLRNIQALRREIVAIPAQYATSPEMWWVVIALMVYVVRVFVCR